MEWQAYIIPIVAVAVWIISALVKNAEKARANKGDDGEEADDKPRQAEPLTDLDRFLDEVNKRRRTPTEPRPAPVVVEVEAAPRAEPPPRRRPQVRRATPVVTNIPEVLPVLVPAAPPPLAPVVSTPLRNNEPTIPLTLKKLIGTQEALRNAVLLQEIFGPPRAHRKPGRGPFSNEVP